MDVLSYVSEDISESLAQNTSCYREKCFGSSLQERVPEKSRLLTIAVCTFPGLLEGIVYFICIAPASDIEYKYIGANAHVGK